jgi:hypothetical protein
MIVKRPSINKCLSLSDGSIIATGNSLWDTGFTGNFLILTNFGKLRNDVCSGAYTYVCEYPSGNCGNCGKGHFFNSSTPECVGCTLVIMLILKVRLYAILVLLDIFKDHLSNPLALSVHQGTFQIQQHLNPVHHVALDCTKEAVLNQPAIIVQLGTLLRQVVKRFALHVVLVTSLLQWENLFAPFANLAFLLTLVWEHALLVILAITVWPVKNHALLVTLGKVKTQVGKNFAALVQCFSKMLLDQNHVSRVFLAFSKIPPVNQYVLVVPVDFLQTQLDFCNVCSAGKYQNQKSQSFCIDCPGGFYSNSTNMAGCYSCPEGSYSPTGSFSCSPCSAGFYQNDTSQSSCPNCFVGYYSLPNATLCRVCSAGTFSNISGSTACISCIPGFYQPLAGM